MCDTVVTFILRLDLAGKYNMVDVSYLTLHRGCFFFFLSFILFESHRLTAQLKYRQLKCTTQLVFGMQFCYVRLNQV